MRQAIHIFRKDVRHCWPYIAAVLALMAYHSWRESQGAPAELQMFYLLPVFPLLMALTWGLAISADIHGESLVGNRQFWVTRPYSWKSLLAAKLAFLVVFLGIPLVISDCAILLASGYRPLSMISALLWHVGCYLALLLAPFLVATLTRQTREFVLAWLLFFVGWYLYLTVQISQKVLPRALSFGAVHAWLLPVALLSLVVWQFSRRRTAAARVFTLALAASMPVWTSSLLAAEMRMRNAPPPQHDSSEFSDVKVQVADGHGYPSPGNIYGSVNSQVEIPIELSGWPRELVTYLQPNLKVMQHGLLATPSDMGMQTSKDGHDWLVFRLDEMGRKPSPGETVDLLVSLSLEIYESPGSVTLQPNVGWTYVPAVGNVELVKDAGGIGHLLGRTLERASRYWLFDLSDRHSVLVATGGFVGWSGISFFPVKFQLSPVYSYDTNFGVLASSRLPLTFTPKRPIGSIRRELKIPQVRLADFETKLP